MRVNLKVIFILIISINFLSSISAVDCPFGIVDEAYPGTCARYIDTNADNLCDLSQEVVSSCSLQGNAIEVKSIKVEYYMWQIALVLVLMYALGLYLVKKEKITSFHHKKFWNVLLLVTFVITAFTSIFALLRLNYNLVFSFPVNIVFWHIEIGWAMLVISIFHTLWHIKYYKISLAKKSSLELSA